MITEMIEYIQSRYLCFDCYNVILRIVIHAAYIYLHLQKTMLDKIADMSVQPEHVHDAMDCLNGAGNVTSIGSASMACLSLFLVLSRTIF